MWIAARERGRGYRQTARRRENLIVSAICGVNHNLENAGFEDPNESVKRPQSSDFFAAIPNNVPHIAAKSAWRKGVRFLSVFFLLFQSLKSPPSLDPQIVPRSKCYGLFQNPKCTPVSSIWRWRRTTKRSQVACPGTSLAASRISTTLPHHVSPAGDTQPGIWRHMGYPPSFSTSLDFHGTGFR